MKILLIYNPTAGSGKGDEVGKNLQSLLKQKKIKHSIYASTSREDLISAITCKANNYDKIFVCGGDGTFRDAIQGMQKIKWSCPLGLFPAGSGNDFAKTLGINCSTEKLLENYLKNNEKNFYSVKCNQETFINVFGVGIDTDILNRRLSLKKYLKGSFCYLISTIISLIVYKPQKYTITIDDKVLSGKYYIVVACNGKFFGGGMKIAPDANVENKKIEVLALKKVSLLKLINAFRHIYSGKHKSLRYVETYSTENLKIEFENNVIKANVDGDVIDFSETIEVSKSEKRDIRIISPSVCK